MGKVFQALNKAQSSEKASSANQDLLRDEDFRATDPEMTGVEGSDNHATEKDATHLNSDPILCGEADQPISPADWDEKIVAFFDQSIGLSEDIRRLRSKIIHPSHGKPLRKILVTSMEPGEGKSFVCSALGISIAQSLEEHALLVGCDLRRSRLASIFNLKSTCGLVNHLSDGADLGQLIMKTGMRKLSIIPSGPTPVNPSELLCSEKVGTMFAELDSRYDDRFTIIDTAPFAVASEVAVLAKHVDGIVLVVRWGRAGRDQVKKMVESLGRDKILGVVFNGYVTNVLSSKVSGYYDYGSADASNYRGDES